MGKKDKGPFYTENANLMMNFTCGKCKHLVSAKPDIEVYTDRGFYEETDTSLYVECPNCGARNECLTW